MVQEIPQWSHFDPSITDWIVLRTSNRWEKKIATSLFTSKVPVFLPFLTRIVHYASKQRTSLLPLFPGYVFASGAGFLGNPAILQATRSQIAQVIKPIDTFHLNQDLLEIASVIYNRQIIQERLYGRVGERVHITGGAFKGYEGIIRGQKPNRHVLILEVKLLNVTLEVELEESQISKD
jgi:hypothetical protein